MKIRYATFTHDGTKRISMSREEILSMLNGLDKNDPNNTNLIAFLEGLERELILE